MPREDQTATVRNDRQGVPGPPLRVQKIMLPHPRPDSDQPIKGGPKTAKGAEDQIHDLKQASPGAPITHREVYVLAKGGGSHRALVLPPIQNGRDQALLVFTSREQAIAYKQAAGLDGYEPVNLSPSDLGNWIRQGPPLGVTLLAVDPNRLRQERGEPQPAISLEGWKPEWADELYREIKGHADEPAV